MRIDHLVYCTSLRNDPGNTCDPVGVRLWRCEFKDSLGLYFGQGSLSLDIHMRADQLPEPNKAYRLILEEVPAKEPGAA